MGFFNLLCLMPPEKILRIFFNTPHQYNKLAMIEIHWNVSQVLPTNSNPTCFSCNFPSSVSDSSSTQRAQGSSPWLLSFLGPISKPSRTIPPLRPFSNLHSGYTGVPLVYTNLLSPEGMQSSMYFFLLLLLSQPFNPFSIQQTP